MGILGTIKNKAIRRKNELNEKLIESVEEKWVDIESIVNSYRSGRLNFGAFKETLRGKIESINRLYKPSIHQLDIFFVKYTEKMVEEYLRMLVTEAVVTAPAVKPVAPVEAPVTAAVEEAPVAPPIAAPVQPETPEPVSEISFPTQEDERLISEMAGAAAADDNMQLESFLEMEPDNQVIETIAPELESEELAKAAETDSDTQPGAAFSQETMMEFEDRGTLPPPPLGIDAGAVELPVPETIAPPPDGGFSFSGRISSEPEFEPVLPPPPEMPKDNLQDVFEAKPKFSPPPVVPPRPQPFSLPSRSPVGGRKGPVPHTSATPAFTKDEVARPATLFDVEAETIIVDRSSIMGAHPSAQDALQDAPQESGKKSIGITGEDVSDTFDKFFGLGG
jgi:hypothetical protein